MKCPHFHSMKQLTPFLGKRLSAHLCKFLINITANCQLFHCFIKAFCINAGDIHQQPVIGVFFYGSYHLRERNRFKKLLSMFYHSFKVTNKFLSIRIDAFCCISSTFFWTTLILLTPIFNLVFLVLRYSKSVSFIFFPMYSI